MATARSRQGRRSVATARRSPSSSTRENGSPRLGIDCLDVEESVRQAGYRHIAGVDEVGRGCWAGPVYAAAVILPFHCFDDRTLLAEVTDSKLLAPAKRERLAADILRLALCATVAWVEAPTIDQLNILRATRLAMQAALACTSGPPSFSDADGLWRAQRLTGSGLSPDYALTDAVPLPDVLLPQRAVIRGDRQCLSIAAASIVAKVTRDAEMRRRAAAFSPYDFASNKGYGSRRHMQALRSLGVTTEHRRSFAPVKYLLGIRDHVAGHLPGPERS